MPGTQAFKHLPVHMQAGRQQRRRFNHQAKTVAVAQGDIGVEGLQEAPAVPRVTGNQAVLR